MLLAAFTIAASLRAQNAQVAPSGLTIRQAVAIAAQSYPAVNVSEEQLAAASARIRLARSAYLPRVDSLAQVNRATRNNVFGLLLPQSVIPSISGPVLGSNNFGTVWGSAAGVTVNWEPFDFGLRKAVVDAATAAKTRSEAAVKRTQFEVSVSAADAYLTLAASQETVRAAQASVERAESFARSVRALVDAQLRPGADASRAEAEVAAARTQLAQAEQAADIARALLSQYVGIPREQITIAPVGLRELPVARSQTAPTGEQNGSARAVANNPVALEQNAAVEQQRAELQTLAKSYAPRFAAQGSTYVRGTGARTDGTRLGGLNGLAADTQNYALGLTITFPLMDFASIHAREAVQAATVRAESARYRQITTELEVRRNTAIATLEGSRKIAANTPIAVSAARTSSQQANARFSTGLGTIVEVAEAQRLQTQAEIDDALARLGVWRALLAIAAAEGDLQPFLAGTAP